MPKTLPALLTALALALTLSVSGATSTAQQPFRVSLPLITAGGPRGALGVEIAASLPGQDVRDLNPGWLRRNGLSWSDVEPVPGGGYRWDAPAVHSLEAQLAEAGQRGFRTILVVQGSPRWAVEPYQVNCAPIAAQHRDDFARFMAEAVRRYSAPPYNVKYWEIGNEPDAFVFTTDSPYGCWGQPGQELYGGEAYGELVKAAYPAIKAVDPGVQVLNGGLLLDKPYNPRTGEGRSARFLEGMLAAGAGGSFDILAFHSYSYYDGTPDGGLAQDWKPAYLRQILTQYGVSKPLLNTEGALLCTQPSQACAQAQAHAMARLYVRALRDNLAGFIWYLYDSDAFRSTALVEPANPGLRRPAYAAFVQASSTLDGLQYIGPLGGLPQGAEGHRLAQGPRETLVAWSNTPQPVNITLGQTTSLQCEAWDGQPVQCAPIDGVLSLELGPGPLYVTVRR